MPARSDEVSYLSWSNTMTQTLLTLTRELRRGFCVAQSILSHARVRAAVLGVDAENVQADEAKIEEGTEAMSMRERSAVMEPVDLQRVITHRLDLAFQVEWLAFFDLTEITRQRLHELWS